MKRGDVVLVAEGKPRPAVVVQSDLLATPTDILICPLTSFLVDSPIFRLTVEPDPTTGLATTSQIMVDKVGPARRDRIGKIVGRLTSADVARLDTALLVVLDLVGQPAAKGS